MPPHKHFNIAKLRKFIAVHGVTTVWWKRLPCPCLNIEKGETNPECLLCGGDGEYFYDATTIRVLLQGMTFDKSILMAGFLNQVVVNCTLDDQRWVGDGDRFVPGAEQTVESELFRRGESKPGGGTRERLAYRYPTSLEKVIDVAGVNYVPGTDIELIADPSGYVRKLHWITAGPAVGVQYAVRYRTTAEFRVFLTQPRVRNENDVKLPTFVRLERINLVLNK